MLRPTSRWLELFAVSPELPRLLAAITADIRLSRSPFREDLLNSLQEYLRRKKALISTVARRRQTRRYGQGFRSSSAPSCEPLLRARGHRRPHPRQDRRLEEERGCGWAGYRRSA